MFIRKHTEARVLSVCSVLICHAAYRSFDEAVIQHRVIHHERERVNERAPVMSVCVLALNKKKEEERKTFLLVMYKSLTLLLI